MSKIILIIISMFSSAAFAKGESCSTDVKINKTEEKKDVNTEVPANLKGATIIIKTADGKETAVPAETFKVVPRKQQFVVVKTKEVETIKCTPTVTTVTVEVEKEVVPLKNRLSLLVGVGLQGGFDVSRNGDTVEIVSRIGPVGGVQYQRLVTKRWSVGGQVLSNESVLLNAGFDF